MPGAPLNNTRKSSFHLLDRVEEMANIGSYETDLRTGKWRSSPQFIKIFGLAAKPEYTEKEFQKIVHPDDFQKVMDYYNQCLSSGNDFNMQYRCIRPDKSIVHVVSKSKIIRDDDGVPVRIIGIKQDITEQKIFEEKLLELNQQNQEKNNVLAVVAHDLRSPVGNIMSLTELLLEYLPGEQKEYAALILEACHNAMAIIDDIVEISRIEEQNPNLKKESANLIELVKKVVENYYFTAKEKNIRFRLNLEEELFARLNIQKFKRAINNLISNAIKFSHQGGLVEISARQENTEIVISIKDHGIGISRKNQKVIFNKYSNARKTGTSGEASTGLGLFITKNIIEFHQGRISVESEAGNGATFIIHLPICPS